MCASFEDKRNELEAAAHNSIEAAAVYFETLAKRIRSGAVKEIVFSQERGFSEMCVRGTSQLRKLPDGRMRITLEYFDAVNNRVLRADDGIWESLPMGDGV